MSSRPGPHSDYDFFCSSKSEVSRLRYDIIIAIIVFVLWLIVEGAQSIRDANEYNGGICKLCGGNYVFQNAVGHRYETNYVYICDQCGHMIEANDYYGEGERP